MGIKPFPSFLTLAFIAATGLATVSCQARPNGYWTSPNRSQALTNQEYPARLTTVSGAGGNKRHVKQVSAL